MESFEQLEDGIYFRLDEDIYHGQRRFSGSGVQDMLVSPGNFWKESWLNPKRERTDTKAKLAGTAYHHARLQPEIFANSYLRGPDPADYGDKILRTHTDIKEALADLGQPKTKAGETVIMAALRLRDAGYRGPIWHLIEAEFEKRLVDEGKTGLDPVLFDEISEDASRLRSNPKILELLTGGESEVSVLWTDERGVKWKARFDFLKPVCITDFKTFENSSRKNLEQCIADAIRFNRYYIQGAVYWQASEQIRAGLRIAKIQNKEQKVLIEAIRANPAPLEYWWVFQEKKGVPNILARRYRMGANVTRSLVFHSVDEAGLEVAKDLVKAPSALFRKALSEIKWARDMFLSCPEIWGDQPWGPLNPVDDIDDEAFPPYFLEN